MKNEEELQRKLNQEPQEGTYGKLYDDEEAISLFDLNETHNLQSRELTNTRDTTHSSQLRAHSNYLNSGNNVSISPFGSVQTFESITKAISKRIPDNWKTGNSKDGAFFCSDDSGQKVFTAAISEHDGVKGFSYNILNILKADSILDRLKETSESFRIDKCNSTSALDKLIAKFGIDRLELGAGVTNPQVRQHFEKIQQEFNNNPALDPTSPRTPTNTKPS